MVPGRQRPAALKHAAVKESCLSKDPAPQWLRTSPAPAFQLMKLWDQGVIAVIERIAKVIQMLIFNLQLKANHRPGEYGKWSDWSMCTAPDCKNNPNHAVMTRTQRNLADPADVNTQEIPCESPCPPGEDDMLGSTDNFSTRLLCVGGCCKTNSNWWQVFHQWGLERAKDCECFASYNGKAVFA